VFSLDASRWGLCFHPTTPSLAPNASRRGFRLRFLVPLPSSRCQPPSSLAPSASWRRVSSVSRAPTSPSPLHSTSPSHRRRSLSLSSPHAPLPFHVTSPPLPLPFYAVSPPPPFPFHPTLPLLPLSTWRHRRRLSLSMPRRRHPRQSPASSLIQIREEGFVLWVVPLPLIYLR
jgi:hypothetical protein